MKTDKLTIEILADGTIKTVADGISPANHDNAENFIRNAGKLAGGTVTRKMRDDLTPAELRKALEEHQRDGHTHGAGHTHTHSDGTTHSH